MVGYTAVVREDQGVPAQLSEHALIVPVNARTGGRPYCCWGSYQEATASWTFWAASSGCTFPFHISTVH